MRLNLLGPHVEQIDSRLRSKEAHVLLEAVAGGHEAAPGLRGRGQAGQSRVVAAEAGVVT